MLMQLKRPHQLSNERPNIICGDYMPMVENSVMMLFSAGGVGKSYVSLRATISYLVENRNKKALLWLTEDDEGETRYRFFEVLKTMGVDYNEIKDRITITDQTPIKFTRLSQNNLDPTPEYFEIRKELIDFDFVVIDPLLQFNSGEENNNTHAGVLMGLLKEWAKTDKTTILILHHATITQYGSKARGAGDFVNGTRGTYELSVIKTMGDNKELIPDVEKSHKRKLVLTKDNGLSRFVMEKYNSRDFEVDVFPVKYQTLYKNKDGHRIPAPTVTEYKMPVTDNINANEIPRSNENTISISIANHNDQFNPRGFKKEIFSWDELVDVMSMGKAYSPSFFKDDYRKSSNYIGGNEVVFLDIDDGMTLEQAKKTFKDYQSIIVTTKSHQKEKHGVINDRFRVALKLKEPIMLNADDYRTAMQAIFDFFGSVADKATKDPARFFFSSPLDCEVHYTKGTKLFDWKPIYQKVKSLQLIDLYERQSRENKVYDDATLDEAQTALNFIPPDCDYEEWTNIGMALKAGFSDIGFELWDSWSSRGSKYNEREMPIKWKSFTGGSIGIATLFYYAKENGWVKNNISMSVL